MAFYFTKFENRVPPQPLKNSLTKELLWQFLAVTNLVFGAWYILWRWTSSINYNSLTFSIILLLAETFSFIGLILFTINLWKVQDYEQKLAPKTFSECINNPDEADTRPLSVDVFIATYSEDIELVRLSIIDAKNIRYPHDINLIVHILDDGRRPEMKRVAHEEGVNYITRNNNIGFKAGNLRNAMEKTYGDFIVICDADTRPFPTILEDTLGYFRDHQVAWVQTPQWFYDLPEGKNLKNIMKKYLSLPGYMIGNIIEKVFGEIVIGKDPFVNDAQMFYDLIQRRRNWANAAFCSGAGSIHRREAVMEAALKSYSDVISKFVERETKDVDESLKQDLSDIMTREMSMETEFTPYMFHVSEDIYTSILLHSDRDRKWKSVFHPVIESKMLSPQDLYSWAVQRFKYAGGTLDIAFNDNPIFREGLTPSQRLMYATTIWSYFGCIWNFVFLVSPLAFFFFGISPVSAYTTDFFLHITPFLILNELAFMVGTWGISTFKGKTSYLSFFPINLRALLTVIRREKIKFPVTPKDRQEGNFFHLVIPQFSIMVLTIIGIIYTLLANLWGYKDNMSGLVANSLWGINNIVAMSGIVFAAFWKPDEE